MYSSHRSFVDRFVESGGGGGNSTLGGPYGLTPVFRTGDFSNSSTPPHQKNTWSAAAESNRAHRGCNSAARHLLLRRMAPQGYSNTQSRVWNPLASPSATGAYGAPGRIRTGTVRLLRPLSLPSW